MSITRYSREVHFDDLNNVHTYAALCVPPGSRVLDLGAAEGSVARVLAARGCDVTAVERDADGVQALTAAGLRALKADIERDGDLGLPGASFDVILLLDVLEHLVDPAAVLARVSRWLAPGGRVLISVPHVAHAAVRLSLLQGRFPRTDIGLLDRTHLQFFDRVQLDELLQRAGLAALDVLTVDRELHQTELPIDASQFPPEVVAAATSDPSSRIYQFFVIARPAAPGVEGGGLLQRLLERMRAIEASYRALEVHATRADAERLALLVQLERRERRPLARRPSTQTAHAPSDIADVTPELLDDLEADRDALREQLSDRMRELQEAIETISALHREVAVQRAFAQRLGQDAPPLSAELRHVSDFRAGPGEALSNDALVALAAEVAEYRRLPYAMAFSVIRRVDTVLFRIPRVRRLLGRMAHSVGRRTR